MSALPLCPPSAGALPTAPVRAPLVLRHADDLTRGGRRALVATVLVAHGLGAWGLWRLQPAPAPVELAPLTVQWIAPPAATPAPPPPRPARTPPPRPAPVLAAAPRPEAAPRFTAPPTPEPAPLPPITAAPAAAPAPAAPPAPPAAPAGPVQVAASALRYVVPPQQVYPAASRRLGESGTVLVKVIVDVQGRPRHVSLHRSCGHARLDEQALQAMRAARFQPHTEQGVAVEAQAVAPLAYELE